MVIPVVHDLAAKLPEDQNGGPRLSGKADINGDSSGSMPTGDLDIANEMSAISMTEEGQRQILKKLEKL